MIWTAFILGIAGSLHCLGMCGPLALALPAGSGTRGHFVTGRLVYNLGRVVTYACLGAVFGLVGQTFALAGWQRGLSIASGCLMLLAIWGGHRLAGGIPLKGLRPLWSKLLATKTHSSLFAIGILNGLLPCGLVYGALAGAAASGHALQGALFMVLFGFGTLPAMFAVSLGVRFVTASVRQRVQRWIPLAATCVAILFILRGMSLGIPYVSPVLGESAHAACCHE